MDSAVLDLVPLLRMRRLLKLALMPVYPSAEFRDWLGAQLLADATRMQLEQEAGALAGNGTLLRPGRREIIIGAAVGSAVSLAGIIALLIHLRTAGRHTSPAA